MPTLDPVPADYLQGPRLQLRAMEPEDLDFLYQVENAPESWDVANLTAPYSRYTIRQYLAAAQNDLYVDRQLRLMVTLRQGGETVGIVDLTDFAPQHARAELGVVIAPAYRRQGYACEAVGILCRYAFGPLHLHQVTAHVATDNAASLRVFQACGFVECGRLRQWWRTPAGYQDVVVMQCVHSDY